LTDAITALHIPYFKCRAYEKKEKDNEYFQIKSLIVLSGFCFLIYKEKIF